MAGTAGEIWESDDAGTVARMNQKTLFVGTGVQGTAISTTYPGMLVYPTTTSGVFTADKLLQRNAANSAWVGIAILGANIFTSLQTVTGAFSITAPDVSLVSTSTEAVLELNNSNGGKKWQILSSGTGSGFGVGNFSIYQATDSLEYLTLVAPADTETALYIRRNKAGVFDVVRVSMGAVDSGGSGFKYLRVPN